MYLRVVKRIAHDPIVVPFLTSRSPIIGLPRLLDRVQHETQKLCFMEDLVVGPFSSQSDIVWIYAVLGAPSPAFASVCGAVMFSAMVQI